MSASYTGTTAGQVPALDWGNMSAQAQTENDGSTSGSSATMGSGTDDSTSTTTHTGTDSRAISDSTLTGVSQATSNSGTGTVKERTAGRDGLTPQAAFLEARKWIVISDAFDWLKAELNDCFLGIIEV